MGVREEPGGSAWYKADRRAFTAARHDGWQGETGDNGEVILCSVNALLEQ